MNHVRLRGGVLIISYLATTTTCCQGVSNSVTRGITVEKVIGALHQVSRLSIGVVHTRSNGPQALPENVGGVHDV